MRENNLYLDSIFLKQLTTFYYDRPLAAGLQRKIIFRQSSNELKLPLYLIDNVRPEQVLYILRWERQQREKLFVKKMTQIDWVTIDMNYVPQRVAITDDHIFLICKKQLYIVSLIEGNEKLIFLEDDKIADVKLCFTDLNQPGLSIVYFNNKLAYYTREYSKSSQNSLWPNISPFLNILAKQKQQFHFLHIIMPRLIGITASNGSLVIYDLNRMVSTNLSVRVEGYDFIKSHNIQWRCQSIDNDEKIHIFVQDKNTIFSFQLRICKYEHSKTIPLLNIVKGNVIDWEKCTFKKNSIEIKSQFFITDFAINNHYLIYREQKQAFSQIPTIRKIKIDQPKQNSLIISQQSQVWRSYYNSTKQQFINNIQFQIQQKLSETNNIPTQKKKLKVEVDSFQYLNKWRSYCKYNRFFEFQGQLYISRRHSISSLEQISRLQFELQEYSEQDRLRDQQLKIGGLITSNNKCQSYDKTAIQKEYIKIVTQMKRSACGINLNSENPQNQLHLSCTYTLLTNSLKDKIQHNILIINYALTLLKPEKSYKNRQLIRLLQYLNKSYSQAQEQFQVLGNSFLSLFMGQNCKKITSKNSLNIVIIISKLMENMLPDSFTAGVSDMSKFSRNSYLQFLIRFITCNNDESVKDLAQREIRKMIFEVYPVIQDKTQNYLLKNISFIRAYLLSHPQTSEFLAYSAYLVKEANYYLIIQEFKPIFHLIPAQIELLLNAEFIDKKNNLSSQIFIDPSSQPELILSQREKAKDYLEMAKIILSSHRIAKPNQKYEQDLKIIMKYLQQIDSDSFVQFDRKFISLYRERISVEILHLNYSHILQIQEAILIKTTDIFDKIFQKIKTVQPVNFNQLQKKLILLITQLENSLLNYKKYWKKMYKQKKIFQSSSFIQNKSLQQSNMRMIEIMNTVSEQEQLMSNQFLEQQIKIQNNYLSSTYLFILKIVASVKQLLKLAANNSFNLQKDEFVDQLLKKALSVETFKSQQMDFLIYHLLKKGEKYIKRYLSRIDKTAALKIKKYLINIDDNDILLKIAMETIDQQVQLP